MLTFRSEHVPLILSGAKWQTRRLWAKPRVTVGSLQKCYSGGLPISRCPNCDRWGYVPGKARLKDGTIIDVESRCPICDGTARLQPFATVRVLRVWRERLDDISEADAQAEGYESVAGYIAAFYRINQGKPWPDEPLVFAVEFELVEPARA